MVVFSRRVFLLSYRRSFFLSLVAVAPILPRIHLTKLSLCFQHDNDGFKGSYDRLPRSPLPLLPPSSSQSGPRAISRSVSRPPVPDTSIRLDNLAGPHLSWLRALLTSSTVIRGSSYIDNPIRRLPAPRTGQKINHLQGSLSTGIDVFGAIRTYGPREDSEAVEIKYTPETKAIDIIIFEECRGVAVPLSMKLNNISSLDSVPIHKVADGHNLRIKDFYWRLWLVMMRTLHLLVFERISTI